MHNIRIIANNISFLIRKIQKYTSPYPIVDHIKTKKILFAKIKTKYNGSYYETTSYNSLPDSTGDVTSIFILPFKKSFMLFLYRWQLGNNL
jgi:hypothetical protein